MVEYSLVQRTRNNQGGSQGELVIMINNQRVFDIAVRLNIVILVPVTRNNQGGPTLSLDWNSKPLLGSQGILSIMAQRYTWVFGHALKERNELQYEDY